MANTNVGSVWFDVNANTKGLMSASRDVDKATGAIASSLKQVSVAIAGVFAAGSLAKFFSDAANAAKDFNASVSELSAITGAVGKDLEFLRGVALEFGATTTLSASQAAAALKLVASAKPDLLENGAALKEVTKQAILLAEAAGVDLTEAATTVGKSLNQFGAEADEAARFVNVLAAGAKFGSSEIAATSVALKSAGVAANSAKISFEETNAAVQVLATVGLQGEQAGTALRNIFLKLNNATDKNLRPSVVGLSAALQNVNKLHESGADQVKRFGLENIVAAQTLLDNVDNLDKLTSKLTGTNTALEQASTKINNLDGDLKALNSAFEALQINIGSLADGELRTLTQAATGIIQAINGNEDALREWGGVINGVQTAAESLAILLAARLVGSIAAVGTSFIVAQAEALRYQAALASLAGVSGRAAIGMTAAAGAARLLSGAMALVGGPVGAIALAAAALIYFYEEAETAEERSSRLSGEVDNLKNSFLGLTEAQRQVEISKLNTEMSALRTDLISATNSLMNWEEQAQDGNAFAPQKVEFYRKRIKELNEQLDALSTKQRAIFQAGMPEISNTPQADAGGGGGGAQVNSEVENINDKLAEQMKQLQMTANEWEMYSLKKQLAEAGATPEQIRAATEALKEQQDFIKQKNAQEQAAKNYQQDVQDVESPNDALKREFEERLEIIRQAYDLESAEQAKRTEEGLAAEAAYQKGLTDIQRRDADLRNKETMSTLSVFSDFFGQMAGIAQAGGKKMFTAWKIAATAQAVVSTALAVSKALASAPPPMNFVAAAAAGVAGAAQVAQIRSTTYGGGRLYGGNVNPGTMYPVNENGAPEMFTDGTKQYLMPNTRGEVISNKDATSAGGGLNVYNNIVNNTSAQVTSSSRVEGEGANRKLIIDTVVSSIVSGGPVRRAITDSTTAKNRTL